jgi:hypothetical protein
MEWNFVPEGLIFFAPRLWADTKADHWGSWWPMLHRGLSRGHPFLIEQSGKCPVMSPNSQERARRSNVRFLE